MNIKIVFLSLIAGILHLTSSSQQMSTDLVKADSITSPFHLRNIGKVTFMEKLIPIEQYGEKDFLKEFELQDGKDLNIRVFLGNSLTNYLHQLGPELSVEELVRKGNYQFAFYVDSSLVYQENLHPGAGLPEHKNSRTILRVPFMSSTNEDSWGRFLWNRFLFNGGEEALNDGNGSHVLKIELRPYLKLPTLKIGSIIAQGELNVSVQRKPVEERQIAIQQIQPGSDWDISADNFDTATIRKLNQRIAEGLFKDITSIVIIKNGKLLIEEYFNGANRHTLHNTRSVGKSFGSTLTGMATHDGFLKSENQMLKEFYNLRDFANYSPPKDSVTLRNFLTMSSAFDGSDFNDDSPGNEEKMYPTQNWVKFTLDLGMDSTKVNGQQWDYFTAGVVLLGNILHNSISGGLEKYADEKLFKPLGIKKYEWPYSPQKVVSMAGGLSMSSLDFAKFGQLYKGGGTWKGRQILPKEWVAKTFTKHLPLPDSKGQYYGYLFWNRTYQVNGQACETFYATGNGGNKIFIFQDQPFVIVITATAYNKPYGHVQVDRMMERYILPAVLE